MNFEKITIDPDEKFDVTWIFGMLETGEAISSHQFSAPAQVVLENESASGNEVTAYISLSGAVVGQEYDVSCLITTDATPARKYDRTIRFQVIDK